MPLSDSSLLQSFAADRGEQAFRALTDRYLGLIYHTALRRTGNRSLSEEISQNVLCALAKKAGTLAKHPERLAPWLHRATIYESLKAMRSESAHQRRKELRHPDQIPDHAPESPWTDALPVLDASLDKLSESDRTVLLLHFFENHSFPQISRALGRSTEAVQKQSRRALEKLARLLRGKGVALSVTGIAAGLSAEFVKAAPLQLAETFSATAFTTAAGNSPSLLTILAMKPKILIPATLLVCGLPLAFQQAAISEVKSRNKELLALAAGTPSSEPTASRRTAPETAGNNVSSNFDFFVLADELENAMRIDMNLQVQSNVEAFRRKLASLGDDDLIRLIREGPGLVLDGNKKRGVLRALVVVLGDRNPELALESAVAAFQATPSSGKLVTDTKLGHVLAHWARKDPSAALAWLKSQQQDGRFNAIPTAIDFPAAPGTPITLGSGTPGPFAQTPDGSMIIPLCSTLIEMGSPLAKEMFLPLDGNARSGLLQSMLSDFGYPYPLSMSSSVGMPLGGSIDWSLRFMRLAREFTTKPVQEELFGRLLNARHFALTYDDSKHRAFFDNAGLDDAEKMIAARYFAGMVQSLEQSSGADPNARAMIESRKMLITHLAPGFYDTLVDEAREKEDRELAQFEIRRLQALRNNPSADDEELVRVLTRSNFKKNRAEALEQAGRIKDPEKRAAVITHLNQL